MRGFLIVSALVIFGIISVRDFVGGGKLLEQADKHPDRRGTATVLYYVGRYYELFSRDEQCIEYFERIVDRYPKSRYGMESKYALATAFERKKDYRRAVEEFEEFLEMYPKNNYTVSVRNNIEILKSR